MDAVSYSLASKQAQRIEKFIENPDSTSGIVTVPSTIATGETITIPAGRTAILPDVTVEGDLLINGTVFIPTGTTYTQQTVKTEAISNVAGTTVVNVTDVVSKVGDQTIAGTKTFLSSPVAPTPTAGDSSTKVATTAYVDGKMVRGTAITASGTSIDFTGIPSWVKRITVMFDGVSTNGTSNHLVRLGYSGGVETSGYISNLTGVTVGGSGIGGTALNSFLCGVGGNAANVFTGSMILNNIGSQVWVCSTTLAGTNSTFSASGAGSKTLPGTLDRIRITTANGTDTFDAGQINILYEG